MLLITDSLKSCEILRMPQRITWLQIGVTVGGPLKLMVFGAREWKNMVRERWEKKWRAGELVGARATKPKPRLSSKKRVQTKFKPISRPLLSTLAEMRAKLFAKTECKIFSTLLFAIKTLACERIIWMYECKKMSE